MHFTNTKSSPNIRLIEISFNFKQPRKRITKVLIRLRLLTVWSAPLLSHSTESFLIATSFNFQFVFGREHW